MSLSFNGKEVNKICFNNNVGYTAVGNPTIVDGVASGFSNSDYVKTESALPSSPNSIEIGFHFSRTTITESGTFGLFDGSAYKFAFYTGSNNIIQCFVTYNGSTVYKTLSSGSSSATYLKILLTRTQLNSYESTDGHIYTQVQTHSGSFDTNIGTVFFGTNSLHPKWKPYIGSIYLNETYIKVNGVTGFSGKEQASKNVNYVIKDGKLVWANPNL